MPSRTQGSWARVQVCERMQGLPPATTRIVLDQMAAAPPPWLSRRMAFSHRPPRPAPAWAYSSSSAGQSPHSLRRLVPYAPSQPPLRLRHCVLLCPCTLSFSTCSASISCSRGSKLMTFMLLCKWMQNHTACMKRLANWVAYSCSNCNIGLSLLFKSFLTVMQLVCYQNL